jgi:hypothetical protein
MISVRCILEEFATDIIDIEPDMYLVTHDPTYLTPIVERLIPYGYCCVSTDYISESSTMTKFEPMDEEDFPNFDFLFE